MAANEVLNNYVLPPLPDGPIRTRFDSDIFPELQTVNEDLDNVDPAFGRASTQAGHEFDALPYSDGYASSQVAALSACELTGRRQVALALEVLDAASRWPNSQIDGTHYADLALRSARYGEPVLA